MGGGAILDLGCYPISLSTKIASLNNFIYFEKIDLIEKKVNIGPTDVDIDSYVTLKFDNGFISRVGASFSKDLGRKTEIKGSRGELIIEDAWTANPSRIILKKNGNEIVIDIMSKKNIYSYEIDSISEFILNKNIKKNTGLSIDETIINMKIIDSWKN